MPRGHANRFYSQLSVVIPRAIHQNARRKAIRSGAPSFAAYVATLLERAPDVMDAADLAQAHANEVLLKMHAGSKMLSTHGQEQKGVENEQASVTDTDQTSV